MIAYFHGVITKTTPSGSRLMNRRKPNLSVSSESIEMSDKEVVAMDSIYDARSNRPRNSPAHCFTGLHIIETIRVSMGFSTPMGPRTCPSEEQAQGEPHPSFSQFHPGQARSSKITTTDFEWAKHHELVPNCDPLLKRNATPSFLSHRRPADMSIYFRSRWIDASAIDEGLLAVGHNGGLRSSHRDYGLVSLDGRESFSSSNSGLGVGTKRIYLSYYVINYPQSNTYTLRTQKGNKIEKQGRRMFVQEKSLQETGSLLSGHEIS
jgi:hypothetical protein